MSIITYQQLKENIFAYCQKTEESDPNFSRLIPYFVDMAMSQIYRDCDVFGIYQIKEGTFIEKNPFIKKPTLWARTISFSYSSDEENEFSKIVFLSRRNPEIVQYSLGNTDESQKNGLPQIYSDKLRDPNNELAVYPVPDKKYKYTLVYSSQAPSLTINEDDEVNYEEGFNQSWVSQQYPELIFQCSLMKAFEYENNTDKLNIAAQAYNKILNSVREQAMERSIDHVSLKNTA